jgi:hypothetical protein
MTILPYRQARAAVDVPWDRARERRVLEGALDSWQRRVRRKRTLGLSAALMAMLLVGRVLPRLSVGGDGTRPGLAVPAAQLAPSTENDPALSLSEGAAPRASSGSTGGFAGTGGHGGTGSTGLGGSAGTG